MPSYHLNVCDLQVSFRTEADTERVELARRYVEDRYSKVKAQGGHQLGRDRLLAILLISMADDILQIKDQNSRTDSRLDELLQSLKEISSGKEDNSSCRS
jgi:cell division protein ZapA